MVGCLSVLHLLDLVNFLLVPTDGVGPEDTPVSEVGTGVSVDSPPVGTRVLPQVDGSVTYPELSGAVGPADSTPVET